MAVLYLQAHRPPLTGGQRGVPVINVVRSPAQAQPLWEAGATFVCDSSQPEFMDVLTEAVSLTHATLAFDAVGDGELASRILTCVEERSVLVLRSRGTARQYTSRSTVYGGLDRTPTTLYRSYGMAWGVGLALTPFLQRVGPEVAASMRRRVAAGLTSTFANHFTDRLPLAEALGLEVMYDYARQSTGRKYLVTPNKGSA